MLGIFARITKVDEKTRTVTGRAAQELPDRDQEVFHYETSKPNFMKWSAEVHADTDGASLGNVRAMHGNVAAGKLTDIEFLDDEKAIDVCAKIVDDNEWKKILEGVYTGFSIGGRYAKKWPAAVNGKMVNYYTADPTEISIVDRPCGTTAKFFQVHKLDGTTEERVLKGGPGSGPHSGSGGESKQKEHTRKAEAKAQEAEKAASGSKKDKEGRSERAGHLTRNAALKTQVGSQRAISAHDRAAVAHDEAASYHESQGNTKAAEAHSAAAEEHRSAADYAESTHSSKSDDGDLSKREFSQDERDDAADSGAAMPDGSFPIKNKKDLKNAILAHGRAKNPAKAKAHIKARAKALGAADLLPDGWGSGKSDKVTKEFSMPSSATSGISDYDQEGAHLKKPTKKTDDGDLAKREFKGNQHRKGGTVADKMRAANRLSMTAHQMTTDARQSTDEDDHRSAAEAHTAAAAAHQHVADADEDDQFDAQAAADQHTSQAAWHMSRCDKADSGELKKGIPEIATLASLCYSLACLASSEHCERLREGDDSQLPEKLRDCASNLLQVLSEMAAEEGNELGELTWNDREVVSTLYPGVVTSVPNDIGKLFKAICRSTSLLNGEQFSKVQDAVTELGALCKGVDTEDSEDDPLNLGVDDMNEAQLTKAIAAGVALAMSKVATKPVATGTGTVGTEGAKRGAQVTAPSLPVESDNAEDAEVTSDQGQEKPTSTAKKNKKKGDGAFKGRKMDKEMEMAEKRKARAADEDDEDEDDEDGEDDEDAEKMFSAGDLTKAVAAGVRQALNALNKNGGGSVIPRREAPALLAVGKGGEVTKVSSVDELRKSVQNTADPFANGQLVKDEFGRISGDAGTATLIKALRANPAYRLRPEEIPNSF
jgi:hypothetical protein